MTCMLNRFSRMQLCVTPWTVAQPGFSVHEILWARILEWVAISFSRGSSLTQGSNLSLLYLLHWQAGSLPHLNGNPRQRQSLKKMQRNWSCFLSWSYFLFIPFLLYFSLPFPLSFPNSIPNCFFSFPGFWFPLGGYNLISPVWTCFCVLSPSVWLFATSRAASRQAPLSMRILQARMLEWVAMLSSRVSSQSMDQTHISCIAGEFFTSWAIKEVQSFEPKTE